jgi:hypothetical protein
MSQARLFVSVFALPLNGAITAVGTLQHSIFWTVWGLVWSAYSAALIARYICE